MTHTEESLMALALAYAKEFALIKIPIGELYRNVALDRTSAAGEDLLLAICEVLADRDEWKRMHEELAHASNESLEGVREIVQRAEKAEAECERLRKLLAEMRNDWARSADPSGEAWVIEIDAAMKEQP